MLAMYLQLSTNEQTRGIKDTVKIRLPGSLHLTLDQGLEIIFKTSICQIQENLSRFNGNPINIIITSLLSVNDCLYCLYYN
jgi:hypothetical protein